MYISISIAVTTTVLIITTVTGFTPSKIRHSYEKKTNTGRGMCNDRDAATTTTTTLPQYLQEQENVDDQLSTIICKAAIACLRISQSLAKLPIISCEKESSSDFDYKANVNVQGEEQKPMDVLANEIFINHLKDHVAALASEEEEDIIVSKRSSSSSNNSQHAHEYEYEIAFDPLDGSSNLDVNIPTGTIFGIAPHTPEKPFSSSGRKLSAAGYTVYSSALELVISLSLNGNKDSDQSIAVGFTLDPSLLGLYDGEDMANCFVLSRPKLTCPPRGSYYSLNDGREPDWPLGLKQWIHDAKRGKTPSGTIYSSRYVCSLCADVHRTFIKGGWAGNPRPHLRLLYEAAPLAHVAEACGGRGSNGQKNLLDIEPRGLHDRTCVFIGSIEDVNELESYGDIQQSAKTY